MRNENIGENQSVPFPVNLDVNLQAQNFLQNPNQMQPQDQLIQQNIAFANQVSLSNQVLLYYINSYFWHIFLRRKKKPLNVALVSEKSFE